MPDSPRPRCLGLVGGVGVGAAVHYYRELSKAHEARKAVFDVVMVNADMRRGVQFVERHDLRGLADYLASLVARMKCAGAELAAIPAVTPHICIREMIEVSPLPLVNLLDAVAEEVRARQLRRVAVFGTRFVVETGLFGALSPIEVVQPRADEIDFIHKTYFDLAFSGIGTPEHRAGLTKLAHELCRRDGAEAILLAGTDLALIFNETNTDFPHVDCAQVHLRAIERALFA